MGAERVKGGAVRRKHKGRWIASRGKGLRDQSRGSLEQSARHNCAPEHRPSPEPSTDDWQACAAPPLPQVPQPGTAKQMQEDLTATSVTEFSTQRSHPPLHPQFLVSQAVLPLCLVMHQLLRPRSHNLLATPSYPLCPTPLLTPSAPSAPPLPLLTCSPTSFTSSPRRRLLMPTSPVPEALCMSNLIPPPTGACGFTVSHASNDVRKLSPVAAFRYPVEGPQQEKEEQVLPGRSPGGSSLGMLCALRRGGQRCWEAGPLEGRAQPGARTGGRGRDLRPWGGGEREIRIQDEREGAVAHGASQAHYAL